MDEWSRVIFGNSIHQKASLGGWFTHIYSVPPVFGPLVEGWGAMRTAAKKRLFKHSLALEDCKVVGITHTHIHTHTHTLLILQKHEQNCKHSLLLWTELSPPPTHLGASQVALVVKIMPANAKDIRDTGPIPESGGSPGVGNGNPFQYSCLEISMDGGAWWAIVQGTTKSET